MLERIWGKEEPYLLQEGQKDTAIMENSWKFFEELTAELLYDPAILFLYMPRKCHILSNMDVCIHVYCCSTCDSKGIEPTLISINEWGDNEIMVRIQNGILPTCKEKWNHKIFSKMNLESILLSEVNSERNELNVLPHEWIFTYNIYV